MSKAAKDGGDEDEMWGLCWEAREGRVFLGQNRIIAYCNNTDRSGLVSPGFRRVDSETPLCTALSGKAQGCLWTRTIARGQQQQQRVIRAPAHCSWEHTTMDWSNSSRSYADKEGRADLYANIATRQNTSKTTRSGAIPNPQCKN